MDWTQSATDLVVSLISFATMNLFHKSFSSCIEKNKQIPFKIIFLSAIALLFLVPSIPYDTLIKLLLDFAYALVICSGPLFSRILAFIKYQAYYLIGSFLIAIIHSLVTMDMSLYNSNSTYKAYANIICEFALYVVLNMRIILKKLSEFPASKSYKRLFLWITGLCMILLVACSMLLGSNIMEIEEILPLLFSLLLLVTLLCLFVYKKILNMLQENALFKLEVEKNALAQNYFTTIHKNLQELSILRHDFKKHLLVLQQYTAAGEKDKFNAYVVKISDELKDTQLLGTPSVMLSAILNTKNEECKEKGIEFILEQKVTGIYLDDYNMISIFGNMLDNAIAAAEKCPNGTIRLRLISVDSYLAIECTNNHNGDILYKGGKYQTTKTTHSEFHGFGIYSMNRAVENLRGELTISHTADSFNVSIMVPNYLQ